jgi:hypothetical protein
MAVAGTVLLTALTACDSSRLASSGTGGVPVVKPTRAYAPFHYIDPAQKATFRAFIRCASAHGVELEGPLGDSSGNGLYFRVAPGTRASQAAQAAMRVRCPQGTVGTFGTPIGVPDGARFQHAARAFARCIDAHGYATYPQPTFGDDLFRSFWALPFPWANTHFASAARACAGRLRAYVFRGG